jgi:hypothetical protein
MNWKGFGRKWSWPNFKALSRHLPGGSKENHKIFREDTRSQSQYLNPGPPEYEVRALTTRPWSSVWRPTHVAPNDQMLFHTKHMSEATCPCCKFADVWVLISLISWYFTTPVHIHFLVLKPQGMVLTVNINLWIVNGTARRLTHRCLSTENHSSTSIKGVQGKSTCDELSSCPSTQ